MSLYGGIPALPLLDNPIAYRTWHARGGAIISAPGTCGLEDADNMLLASCAAPPADLTIGYWGDAPETGMLTYDVCPRMLTYALVCSRMLSLLGRRA